MSAAVRLDGHKGLNQVSNESHMKHKTVVITGANRGIGRATAVALARQGAQVVLACRTLQSALSVVDEIRGIDQAPEARCIPLNLASFRSVRDFSETLLSENNAIDVLVNNAGVMPMQRAFTDDGFELNIGVNYLGHFLLTQLLLPLLQKPSRSRIVHLSSVMHRVGRINFDSFRNASNYCWASSYAQSKLANLLFSNELSRRVAGTGVVSNAVHPGVVGSGIVRGMPSLVQRLFSMVALSPDQGAHTSLMLSSDPEFEVATGGYYSSMRLKTMAARADDPQLASQLWERSENFTQSG